MGEQFHDVLEEQLRATVSDLQLMTRDESSDIVNLMMPNGVRPNPSPSLADYWSIEFKGATPEDRLARIRLKTRKKMAALSAVSFREAVAFAEATTETLTADWQGVAGYVAQIAENEPWVASLLTQAKEYEANVDVIDHYEFLATLDELTCDECAALDGTIIEGDQFGNPIGLTEMVDVHPNCRCVAVPVSKTWEELGFAPEQEPEGTRIARTGYPQTGPRGGRVWGPSSPTGYIDPATGNIVTEWRPGYVPVGGVQDYVPADTRYKKWKKGAK